MYTYVYPIPARITYWESEATFTCVTHIRFKGVLHVSLLRRAGVGRSFRRLGMLPAMDPYVHIRFCLCLYTYTPLFTTPDSGLETCGIIQYESVYVYIYSFMYCTVEGRERDILSRHRAELGARARCSGTTPSRRCTPIGHRDATTSPATATALPRG